MIHPQSENADSIYQHIGSALNELEKIGAEATVIWLPRDRWESEIEDTTIWGLPVRLLDGMELERDFRLSITYHEPVIV